MTKRELKMGGPGHNGYAYNADVYCVDCGHDIIDRLWAVAPPSSEDDASDSNEWPQPIFFGESEQAEHCGDCGEHLYGENEPEEEEEDSAEEEE